MLIDLQMLPAGSFSVIGKMLPGDAVACSARRRRRAFSDWPRAKRLYEPVLLDGLRRAIFRWAQLSLAAVLLAAAPVGFGQESHNAPEKNRQSLATLIQAKLSREVGGKTYSSGLVEGDVRIFAGMVKGTGQVEGEFIDPETMLAVEVPRLNNLGGRKLHLETIVTAPVRLRGKAQAAPFKLDVDAPAQIMVEIGADIRLAPAADGRVRAEIHIVSWDGTLENFDVGAGAANEFLGPLIRAAAKKLIDENRHALQDDANRALKRASDEGRLEFEF